MSADWEYREVCPDGGCIGVIGDDGLCKVCGRAAPNWGNERKRGLVDDQTDAPADGELAPDGDNVDDDVDAADADAADADAERSDVHSKPPSDDWDQRALCDNGACVGVIGDDGTCSVCGSRPT
jgi:hypothetical protein